MNKKVAWSFIPLIAFIAMAFLLASGLGKDSSELKTVFENKPLPAFELPSLLRQGESVNNDIFLNKWSVFNVWATWCPTCYVEHPYLLEMARSGIVLIGLNYKDEDEAAREYLANYGNPFQEVLVDADGKVGLNLGVYGAPETFLINPKGEVVLRHVGEMNARVWAEKFAPAISQGTTAGGSQ